MAKPTQTLAPIAEVSDRIIIALDVESLDEARDVVEELRSEVGAFKVGLQLFTAYGPAFVRELVGDGVRVFLDLKFHDIPNTVAKAAVEAARLGVWMFNVHTLGGGEMMRRTADETRETCEREGIARPLITGVTILTSSDAATLDEIGIGNPLDEEVGRLAALAAESGLDGVVASPLEVGIVRNFVQNPDFVTVTPGIRSVSATSDDQKRVTTVREAIANGSSYVVIGRPVLGAPDRIAAVRRMADEGK
jgi:orotidine-5'-phosphate decarboxylase